MREGNPRLRLPGFGTANLMEADFSEYATLDPKLQTPNPKPQTPDHKPETPNPRPQNPKPKPHTLNPKPLTSNPNPLNIRYGTCNWGPGHSMRGVLTPREGNPSSLNPECVGPTVGKPVGT